MTIISNYHQRAIGGGSTLNRVMVKIWWISLIIINISIINILPSLRWWRWGRVVNSTKYRFFKIWNYDLLCKMSKHYQKIIRSSYDRKSESELAFMIILYILLSSKVEMWFKEPPKYTELSFECLKSLLRLNKHKTIEFWLCFYFIGPYSVVINIGGRQVTCFSHSLSLSE